MNHSSAIGLINNAALLLALCLLYDMLGLRLHERKTIIQQILTGVVLGAIGLAIMFNPWNFGQGVVFDTRSVLLVTSGFFFGTIPVILAVLMTGFFRFVAGGAGVWTGLAVIVTSGIIGLLWRHYRPYKNQKPSIGELYLLGIVAHLVMLGCFFLLPWKFAIDVLSKISFPVMFIYPIATAILGNLLVMSEMRRQYEQKLRESEERYRELVENANSIILRMDNKGRITFLNEYAQNFFGYKASEIIGKSVIGTIVPEIDSAGIDLQVMIMDIGIHPELYVSNENENMRCDGSRIRIAWTNKPFFDETGAVSEILCVGNDITERIQSEEKLKESEERFKALHDASFGGITIHDKGLILECNQGLADITGYSVEELIGMDGLLLIAPQSREKVLHNIVSGYEKPYEAVGIRKNGEEYPLRLEARGIPYKGKNVRVVEFRNIFEYKQFEAEQERLQNQLLQAQKMESVGRLAGGVAHDFNNMLGVILGHSEMAMESLNPSDPIHKDLREIYKAAERSANLTRQLLAFARKQTIAPKVLNCNDTISGMLNMLQRLIGEDIDLVWSPHANLWSVKVDPSQLDQILANLCVNARDAISGVGKITIETENITFDEAYCDSHIAFIPGEYVQLVLSDNGCGMDKDTLTHLYEPFFTTKEMGKGTGLGLATVYGIVKQNNGFMNVYSELNQGTTFKIYLPRYTDKDEYVQTVGSEQPAVHGQGTILVVEDEPAILAMTKVMLERLGYTVIPANTPGEAIRLAELNKSQIDVLLTDVVMPKMTGRDLVRHMMPLYPDLKTLFMSGYTANVIAHHGVLDEGVHFIEKPFSKKDLADKINEVLNQ